MGSKRMNTPIEQFGNALFSDELEQATKIIEAGLALDATDSVGMTPLMIAVSFGKPTMVEFLLSKGADPDLRDKSGATALLLLPGSLTPEKKKLAKLLLDSKADPNLVAMDGTTFLHRAVTDMRPEADLISLALDAGADPTLLNKNRLTALALAEARLDELGEESSEEENIPSQVKKLTSFLMPQDTGAEASFYKEAFSVQMPSEQREVLRDIVRLLGGNAHPKREPDGKNQALFSDILALAIPDDERHKPVVSITQAAEKGDLELVKLFIENGCNLNAKFFGGSLVYYALKGKNPEVVRYIIEQGARVNDTDFYFIAPLADETLYKEICELSGIDAKLAERVYAESVALRKEQGGPAKWVQAAANIMSMFGGSSKPKLTGDQRNALRNEICARLRSEELGNLLNNPNPKDPSRRTMLAFAAENGLTDVVDALLNLGANPDGNVEKGHPPIALAAKYGYSDIVERLLASGASVTGDANEALRFAAERGDLELVKLLLDAGMDPRDKDRPALQSAAGPFAKSIQALMKAALRKKDTKTKPGLKFKKARKKGSIGVGAADFFESIGEFGNGEYCIVFVKADAYAVRNALVAIYPEAQVVDDLLRNSMIENTHAVLGFQLKNSLWTILPIAIGHQNREQSDQAQKDSALLSKSLNTETICFFEDDTSGIPFVTIYDKGTLEADDQFEKIEDVVEDVSYTSELLNIFTDRGIYLPVGYYDSDGFELTFTLVGLSAGDIAHSFYISTK